MRQHRLQEIFCIRRNGLGEVHVGREFLEFRGIDIDHDFLRAAAEFHGIVGRHQIVEPRSDHQDEVAVLDCQIRSAQRYHARLSHRKTVGGGNEVHRVPGGEDRKAERLVKRLEFLRRSGQPYAMPGQYDGALGPVEPRDGLSRIGSQRG